MGSKVLVVVEILLVNSIICLAIISPEDEVTKPPKRWEFLPWPPPNLHSRHASGIKGRISPAFEGEIVHIKSPPDEIAERGPVNIHNSWDIVPDSNSDGGFKLVQSPQVIERPREGGSSNVLGVPGDVNSPLSAPRPSKTILSKGFESGAHRIHYPSSNVLDSGMMSASIMNSGVSAADGSHKLSKTVLSSGLNSGSVIGANVPENRDPSVWATQTQERNPFGTGISSNGPSPSWNVEPQHTQPPVSSNRNVEPADTLSGGYWHHPPNVLTSQWNIDPDCQGYNCHHSSSKLTLEENQQTQTIDSIGQFLPAAHWHGASSNFDPNVNFVGSDFAPLESYHEKLKPLHKGTENAAFQTSPLDASKCPDGATGQFVYRPDCRRFLNCWKGRSFIQVCAPGTLFNPDTLECDFPNKVKCLKLTNEEERWNNAEANIPENKQLVRERNLIEVTSTPSTFIKQSPIPEVMLPLKQKSDCPMEGGTGLAPHPTDCSKFLNCWKGTAHTQNCAPGTLFNPKVLICDFPYNVNCFATVSEGNTPGKLSPNKLSQPTSYPKPTTTKPNQFSRPHRKNNRPNKTPTTPLTTSTTSTTSTTKTTTTTSTTTTTTTTTPRPHEPTYNKPITKHPSGQVLRLRGGPGPWEGYVEIQGEIPGWGLVCDEKNSWTITEATVVCRQLGYERGAELSWQGRPLSPTEDTLKVAVNKAHCKGNEAVFSACHLEPQANYGHQCVIARDAVAVRCYKNWISQCRPGEINHGNKCYNLVVPSVRHAREGFSHGEALRDCQSRRSHLLDITSQVENDFISEWLLQLHPNITNVITAGVGVSVFGRSLWIWEGSQAPFKFTKWWTGWTNDLTDPPKTSGRPVCIVAKRLFPCEHAYYTSDVFTDIEFHSHDHNNMKMCAGNYFYWDTENCSITHSHPYVCERPHDDIGCLEVDKYNYNGTANVTANGLPCIKWDDPIIIKKLSYRVSERERASSLTGHNYCRNVGGDKQPWCFAGKQRLREPCSIPNCWDKVIEKTATVIEQGCWSNEFECQPGVCITTKWKCDGEKDCSNGRDEQQCDGLFQHFTKRANSQLEGHDIEKWLQTDVNSCAHHCQEAKEFTCRSFSYNVQDSMCLLSDSNVGLSGNLASRLGWDYYELNSYTVQCDNKFYCDNEKCINMSQVCNGKNDCGDRSDEKNCSTQYLNYEIRLVGSKISNEGRIEVKVYGRWGLICDDLFGLRDAEVVCRELGFTLGAVEVLPPGSYISRNQNNDTPFLIDDLKCLGNETSILECEFEGWGVHDCLPEEAVSVVCRVPGLICAANQWQCETTKECLPIAYLCDNIDDCDDASDEDSGRCNMPVELRLVGGSSNMEGRVEVRYNGIWGTVCDDDFAIPAATVICHSLGFGGPAQAKKEAAYGPGEGPIWLDQLHCIGNETSVTDCLHSQWGDSNCEHSEDAAVVCSPGATRKSFVPHKMNPSPNSTDVVIINHILPSECGKRNLDHLIYFDDQKARVIGGNEVLKGSYPWQASVRVRTGDKSVHWCGAVVISPLHILTAGHCMLDYSKSAYFIRVGDHDTEEKEGTEQELKIDEIYIHEEFNKGRRLNNDIAVVKLKGLGIQLGPEIMPACLPKHGMQYSPGLNCTISGWGSLKAGGSGYARRLRAAWITLLPIETCRANFVYGTGAISDGMFCAGQLEGGVDSCQGDSGGPIICLVNGEFTLYGITSWGHGCGRPNKPGVYSNVIYYRDWINKKVEDSMSGR